jgi:hypothetical protein
VLERRQAIAVCLVGALLLTGCLPFSLPRVPRHVIESVEGEHVTIVAQAVATNPTEQWYYTYLMLEVGGSELHLDTVTSTLTSNGWEIEYTESIPDNLPSAVLPDQADLSLADFAGYMSSPSNPAVFEEFAKVSTSDDKGYFVAIIMPMY